jgi:hypothetical protein
MSFHVSNLSLTITISDAVRKICKELFAGPGPQLLHHYTSAAKVEDIVQSRSLWATCIDDQSDKTEISHASGLVTRLTEEVACSGTPSFATDVLRRLPFFMEERKQWIYIACFCGERDSVSHWRDYGNYCLTFPTPRTEAPSLALSDTQAECWYQRVIYDEGLQRNAIERALRSIVLALFHHTYGHNEGPCAPAMVDSCARNSAQLLLSLAVGFKRNSFEREREWRIVCAPRLGSNSSAPASIDENFNVNVRQSPQRHLLLQIRRTQVLFQPMLIAPVPFLHWSHNPTHYNVQELDRINNVLKANNRTDLASFPRVSVVRD